MKKPHLVGVTGGIGSGKTTVVNLFKEEFNIPVYIADVEAKRLMQEEASLIAEIKTLIGENAYRNGKLNRAHIAHIVFKDKAQLEALNAIVHPAVRKDFNRWAKSQKSPYVIYESALIFEYKQQQFFDDIILVTAPKELRIKRVQKRSGLSENDIKNRMKQQMPDKLKKNKVNYIIQNIKIDQIKDEILRINNNILSIINKKS